MAKTAVEIAIGLIRIMALWLGGEDVEESGLIRIIACHSSDYNRCSRCTRLPPRYWFNYIGYGKLAWSWKCSNSFGSKAMEELQDLNPEETATNAMCTFLAINTSSINILLILLLHLWQQQINFYHYYSCYRFIPLQQLLLLGLEKLKRFKVSNGNDNDR